MTRATSHGSSTPCVFSCRTRLLFIHSWFFSPDEKIFSRSNLQNVGRRRRFCPARRSHRRTSSTGRPRPTRPAHRLPLASSDASTALDCCFCSPGGGLGYGAAGPSPHEPSSPPPPRVHSLRGGFRGLRRLRNLRTQLRWRPLSVAPWVADFFDPLSSQA